MGKLVGLGTPKLLFPTNATVFSYIGKPFTYVANHPGADIDVHANALVYVGFDGCQSLRCRSYVEYAAEQCQARVNSLVEALTEQGRTILTEVMTILKTFFI